jgi:hypothetical protein
VLEQYNIITAEALVEVFTSQYYTFDDAVYLVEDVWGDSMDEVYAYFETDADSF